MRPIFIRTMNGVGDCILSRPFIRELGFKYRLSLQTPFPQLFTDFRTDRIVRAKTSVPYVQKNIREWERKRMSRGAPKDKHGERIEPIALEYNTNDPTNVTAQIAAKFPLKFPYRFDLPPRPVPNMLEGVRYAVVRPIVHRKEFDVPARNADGRYLIMATEMLNAAGYTTISIANSPDERVEPLPTTIRYDDGQLHFEQMLAIMQNANVVVSGPGFGMLLGLAAKKPLLAAIWGARGVLDNPDRIFDSRMGLSTLTNFSPEPRCPHLTATCDCEKYIPDFELRMSQFIERANARP